MLSGALALVVPALALDMLVGDPVSRWHPVAVFGRGVGRLVERAPKVGTHRQLWFGAALVAGGVLAVAGGSAGLLSLLQGVAPLAAAAVGAILLKLSFAYRQLRSEVIGVAHALEGDDLERARAHLGALVSRDTGALNAGMLGSAAIESLAENLCDSVVAPFFYYLVFGVPGALAYRAVNTLDAMIGYHGRYEYVGRAAAKTDDALNWVPARLTAMLLVAGATVRGADGRQGKMVAARDHGRTESPNAGWPMAALAGALHVRVEKLGHYQLGEATPGVGVSPAKIREAVRVADAAAVLAAGLLVVGAML